MSGKEKEMVGALVGLARSADGETDPLPDVWALLAEGLALISTHPSDEILDDLIARVHAERDRMAPNCALCTAHCGRTDDYDLAQMANDDETVRRYKTDILFNLHDAALHLQKSAQPASNAAASQDDKNQPVALQTDKAQPVSSQDEATLRFMVKALNAFGAEWDAEDLLPIKREAEKLVVSKNCHGIRKM